MTKQKTKGLIIFLLAFFFFLTLGMSAGAQAEESGDLASEKEAYVIAATSVQGVKILSQDGNKIKVGFTVVNKKNAQSNIKYGVQLTKKEGEVSFVAHQKIYDETFSLGEGASAQKEAAYEAPGFLAGKYRIEIILKNDQGLPLGFGSAGELTLSGSGEYIQITNPSCYLTVQGETTGEKYVPEQGVDINESEILLANCEVKNNFSTAKTVSPQFTLYHRSVFGKNVFSEKQGALTLAPGEKKALQFPLPKIAKPQAYDAMLEFLEAGGKVVSSQAVFHYVLRGQSATIQNLRLDKDCYQKGEIAKIYFDWSGSADQFPISRGRSKSSGKYILEIEVRDRENQSCAPAIKKESFSLAMDKDPWQASLAKDCCSPKVSAVIKDSSGKILNENTFSFVSKKTLPVTAKEPEDNRQEKSSSRIAIYLFLALVIFIMVLYFFGKRKKNSFIRFFGMLFFLGSLFLFSNSARAETFETCIRNDINCPASCFMPRIDDRFCGKLYDRCEKVGLSGTFCANQEAICRADTDDTADGTLAVCDNLEAACIAEKSVSDKKCKDLYYQCSYDFTPEWYCRNYFEGPGEGNCVGADPCAPGFYMMYDISLGKGPKSTDYTKDFEYEYTFNIKDQMKVAGIVQGAGNCGNHMIGTHTVRATINKKKANVFEETTNTGIPLGGSNDVWEAEGYKGKYRATFGLTYASSQVPDLVFNWDKMYIDYEVVCNDEPVCAKAVTAVPPANILGLGEIYKLSCNFDIGKYLTKDNVSAFNDSSGKCALIEPVDTIAGKAVFSCTVSPSETRTSITSTCRMEPITDPVCCGLSGSVSSTVKQPPVGNTPPTCDFTSPPKNDVRETGPVSFTCLGTETDSGDFIAGVQIFKDGCFAPLGVESSINPGTATDTLTSEGNYEYCCKVKDSYLQWSDFCKVKFQIFESPSGACKTGTVNCKEDKGKEVCKGSYYQDERCGYYICPGAKDCEGWQEVNP